uniref:Uncharacterized protein n=1 Tax=Tanacetum cinerariifolium TaxID=118510 RepID=A0A6L2L2E0_TANCI|nr:hypothetical protein [Tanacetum cinerariifolium]
MMVQAPKEVGEIPTDTQDTPTLTQPHPLNPRGSTNPEGSRGRKLRVLSLEQNKTNQAAKIKKLKKRFKKLEGKKKKRTHRLKRLYKGRMNNADLFRVNDLDGDEVIMDVTASENVEHDAIVAEKEVSVAANEVVTTVESVEGITTATTPQISKDDVTLAQTLMEIKAAKPKAKGRLQEAKMKAKMDEEERMAKEKNEANRDLSTEERSKLLAKLIESRRKYFAAKRAEEIKNKPPTKAQQKSIMCTYMKNMEGYKQKDFKGKSFDAIKKMFDKVYKRVNTFMAMDSEVMEGSKKTQAEVIEGSSKRARDEIERESAKRQRLKKEDDTAELKRCLEIVLKDDDVTIEATPISSKSPTIVDYKIYKEGKKSYFKIIKADGNSQKI